MSRSENVICDLLHRWAEKEPYYLNMNNDSRVDLKWMVCEDITLIDVSVINTTASSYIHLDPHDALHNKAKLKNTYHESTAVDIGASFKPFIISTFGAMDKNAKAIINIIRANAVLHNIPQSVNNFISELTSSIAVAVQVGNSHLMSMGYIKSISQSLFLYQPSITRQQNKNSMRHPLLTTVTKKRKKVLSAAGKRKLRRILHCNKNRNIVL